MAARRIMVGDQEVEIPDFNFKLMPVILIFFIIWFLFVTVYSVGPDEVGVIRTFGAQSRVEGSGINFMMEILGGALTGNGVCGALTDKERRRFSNGMLSLYIEVEKMVDIDFFTKEVKSYADFVRASRPSQSNDKVLIPGDKEISTNEDRLKNGLPVPPLVWENIKKTADRLNVENLERFEKAIK